MKINKKIRTLLLAAVLTVSFASLVGCTSKDQESNNSGQTEEATNTYKDIKGDEALKLIEDSKEIVIIDVRGKEDYEKGHLTNAINISVDDIEGRLNELESYKDKPVVLYCNSGKKSGEAAKILADNGFKNVNNAEGVKDYKYDLVTYNDVNGYDAEKLISENKDIVVVDVRDEKEFKEGHIENAINISSEEIEKRIDELSDAKDKTVLLYCKSGRRSAESAKKLQEKGFTNVYNSVDGVSEYDFKLVK